MFTTVRHLVDQTDIRILWGAFFFSILWFFLNPHCCGAVCVLTSAALIYGSWSALQRKWTGTVSAADKVVLITGCDSGFGFDLALFLDNKGFTVLATCLRDDGEGAGKLKEMGSNRLHVLPLDVGDDKSVENCLQETTHLCGQRGLWALVNNAGINFLGDVELTTMQQYQEIVNVNLFGMIRTTKAFLPLIRKAKGRIVNTTSVKGRFSLPSNAAYCISKHGGETFSEILRMEMYKFGIKVVIMEPGNFGGATACLNKEGMARIRNDLDQMAKAEDVLELYGGKDYLDAQFKAAGSSAVTTFPTTRPVLDAYLEAIASLNPQARYLIDGSNSLIDKYCLMARLHGILPDPWMDSLVLWLFDLPFQRPAPAKQN